MSKSYKHMNYFAKNEQKKMSNMATSKTSLFSPILKILDSLWVTPDVLSLLWMISIILAWLSIWYNLLLAFILLILHIIFDWLDGSLARYKNIDSNAWAFVDIVVDQSWLVILCLALIYHNISDPFFIATYVSTYIIMIIFLIYSNQLDRPIPFVVRTKYVAFGLLLVLYYSSIYWNIGYDILFKVFSIYQIWVIIYLFFTIRWSLK